MSKLIPAIAAAKRSGAKHSLIFLTLSREGYTHAEIAEGITRVGSALNVAHRSRKNFSIQLVLTVLLAFGLLATSSVDSVPVQRGSQRVFLNAQSATYYVATNGNDANPGTLSQPFQTLTAARNAVAALQPEQKPGTKILIRGGTYPAPTTQLNFSSSLSGSSEEPVVIANYPGEYPIFTAMSEVEVPAGAAGVVNITLPNSNAVQAIYEGSTRRHKARTPNYTTPDMEQADPWAGNFARIPAGLPGTVSGANCPGRGDNLNYCEVTYTPGSGVGELSDPEEWASTEGAKVVLFTGGDATGTAWRSDEFSIDSINTSTHTIRLSSSSYYQLRSGHFFYITGVSDTLDAPGEWLQSGTTLSYYRAASANPVTLSVANTTQYQPYVISGSNMVFRGLSFNGFLNDPAGASSWMVRVSGASNVVIDGWEVSKNVTTGLLITDGSTNITVRNSRFFDIQSHAIHVPVNEGQTKAFTSTGIVIENNAIWDIGLNATQIPYAAITVNVPGMVVRNNRIRRTARGGIGGGGSPNIHIERNVIEDANQLSADSGAISFVPIWSGSARSWIPQGHVISNNYVKNTGGYSWNGTAMKYNYYTWGIYLDDFTSSTTVTNNIITDFSIDCLMNHGGRDNTWENNICYTTRQNSALVRFREDPQTGGYGAVDEKWTEVQGMTGLGFNTSAYLTAFPNLGEVLQAPTASQIQVNNTLKRNILVSTSGTPPQYFYGKNLNTNNVLSNNVVKTTGSDVTVEASIGAGSGTTYTSLASWQAQGFDANTVFADPLFTNAPAGDFSLQAASPALTRGFQQIDQSLYDVKNVLGDAPSVDPLDDQPIGNSLTANWSISPPNTYPLMEVAYQVRSGGAGGSPLTDWVDVTGQSSTTVSADVFPTPGVYAFCLRYSTDVRQPGDGSTGVYSPEACPLATFLSSPDTATPTPSASSSNSTPSPTSTAKTTAKPKTTPKATPTSSPEASESPSPSLEETASPSPSETPPVAAITSPSPSTSSGPFVTSTPFAVDTERAQAARRLTYFIIAGLAVTLVGGTIAGLKWFFAARFLRGGVPA